MRRLQTPPPTASRYGREQRQRIEAAAAEAAALWTSLGPRFDAAWSLMGPRVAASVREAQRDVTRAATLYVPEVLTATGQPSAAFSEATTSELVGITGQGVPVATALASAPVRAKQAVTRGESPAQSLSLSADWLAFSITTILADTQRNAESLESHVRRADGYVRAVSGKACGRCVILAGRWYRANAGFDRHPGCKCYHIPSSEDLAGDWSTNPDEFFHSLTPERQIKLMGSKANAQAVRDGADMAQIINAYGRSSGMQVAGLSSIQTASIGGRVVKFTTAGTTRRGGAYKAMKSHGAVKAADDVRAAGDRYFRSQVVRVMPQSIYAAAESPADVTRLLKLYGWIT